VKLDIKIERRRATKMSKTPVTTAKFPIRLSKYEGALVNLDVKVEGNVSECMIPLNL
jgi:hypothetical protein